MGELKLATRGPWVGGYTSAVPAFMARPDQLVGATDGSDTNSSRDCTIDPFTGGVMKRAGCAILNDTLGGVLNVEVAGLLNKAMSMKCRKLFALDSPSLANGYSTIAGLFGTDTNAGFPTADVGTPGTIWNHSTNSGASTNALKNHSLLEEFVQGTTYNNVPNGSVPAATAAGYRMRVVPVWLESGDGVYLRGNPTGTAGTDLFSQQFFCSGARSLLQTQDWLYSPGIRHNPWRMNKRFNESSTVGSETVRLFPTGPFPPLFPPTATTPSASTSATAWSDGDTFYLSVMFQYADGSYSRPFVPRAAQTSGLTAGLGLVLVGTIAGGQKYRYLTYSNIPVGYDGVVARVLLRSVKQNRTASTDNVTVEPLDLRVIGVLRNNTQKTYVDYGGDDTSLDEDDDAVRFDSFSPRRARYIGTGDQRAIIGYTLPNTGALMLAPIGITTAKDRNFVDSDTNCYGSVGSYVRITSTQLELHYNAGAAPNVATNYVAFDFATYDTVEKLCDAINATTKDSLCKQWACQLAPGIDPSMPSASLTLTTMDIACATSSVSNQTTVTSVALFGPVGIGMRLKGTGIPVGSYVVSKASDSSLTISNAATATGSPTLTFFQDTGDNDVTTGFVSGGTQGYMRAFSSTLPLLLCMKPSAFPDYATPDKLSIYFSGSSPGAASSGISLAPNVFFLGNRRIAPPNPNPLMARQCVGIVDVEGAAVIAYSDGIFMFRNVRGGSSGEDFDDRLATINLTRGCISYLGLIAGHGWAAYPTTEGIVATDKTGREFVISDDIHNPSTGAGDLAYEIGLSAASVASDSDDQYLGLAVRGSQLVVSFRDPSGIGAPRTSVYDFSPGVEASGLEQLLDPDTKRSYIWHPLAVYNVTSVLGVIGGMGSVRNASGRIDYVSFDSNLGTNNGRVDQVNTGTTDNGSAVTAAAIPAPVVPSPFMLLSPQDVECVHVRPVSTSGTSVLEFANDQVPTFNSSLSRALPSSTSKVQYQKQLVPIDQGQRGVADIFWLRWRNNIASVANKVWSMTLRYDETENKVSDS